ncbi:MAG: hypothetical protein ACM33B_14390 [Pseudomonadota bacterium]
MSPETHPPEEGHDADAGRRIDEDAQRYPAHEDPDAVRDEVGLGGEGRTGTPEGAPAPGRDT